MLNDIYWRLRTGSPWADIPERYGPPTTCYNRFVRWRKMGVWDRIFEAISKAYDGDLQMIDSSPIRVHQHGANGLPVLLKLTLGWLMTGEAPTTCSTVSAKVKSSWPTAATTATA